MACSAGRLPQRGRPPKLGGDRENLFHQLDKLIDPMVEHAVFGSRKQAELPLKAQDIPGIDQRAAFDGPGEQLVDRQQLGGRRVQLAAIDGQPGAGNLAADLATHAGRGRRHDVGLPPGRFGIAHRGEQQSQMDVFELCRPAPGQIVIQMLPGTGQRLAPGGRLAAQPLAVLARGSGQQLFVIGIAISGDLLHQRPQRGRRAVRVGPAAAGARGHQDRAGQHGRRLEPQLVGVEIAGRQRPGREGVEHDLLQARSAGSVPGRRCGADPTGRNDSSAAC